MPQASSRSSSISSSSTSSTKSVDIKKKFCCNFPSCGKSFSRSEHLHRHALNHKDGNNTCLRCSAHFRRRDLLDRHMARHKEKDDEAGGEGLGVLATRKRLWRDANGNIVNARRPSYTQEGAKRRQINRVEKKPRISPMERKMTMTTRGQTLLNALPSPTIQMSRHGSISSTIVVDTRETTRKFEYPDPEEPQKLEEDSWIDMTALPSPPLSGSNSEVQSPSAEISDLDALYEETTWPLHHGLPPHIDESSPELEHSEFATPTWSSQPQPFQTFMGAVGELPYDDIFKPDMGMYDWQQWNNQVLMSRCREEKYDPLEERKSEWSNSFPGQDASFRRTFGLGTC